LVWALLILLLMGLPGDVFPEIVTFWDWLSPDKVVHLFVFGTFSFLILWGFCNGKAVKPSSNAIVTSVLIAALYGVLTEFLQYYVFVGRSGNAYDALADVIGAFLGWFLYKPFMNVLKKMK